MLFLAKDLQINLLTLFSDILSVTKMCLHLEGGSFATPASAFTHLIQYFPKVKVVKGAPLLFMKTKGVGGSPMGNRC